MAERLPPAPPPLGRAGDEAGAGAGLADRRDEDEARGAGLADRVRLLLRPAPPAPEAGDEEAEGRVPLRPRRWGVLAALAVICDEVVWCDVVDMTSLALLMTLSICIWGDGEGARRPLPLLPLPPAVGGCTGG